MKLRAVRRGMGVGRLGVWVKLSTELTRRHSGGTKTGRVHGRPRDWRGTGHHDGDKTRVAVDDYQEESVAPTRYVSFLCVFEFGTNFDERDDVTCDLSRNVQ
jgi:hypothetical protein